MTFNSTTKVLPQLALCFGAFAAFAGIFVVNKRRLKVQREKSSIPKATTILLVRHGETPRNKKGENIQGRINDADAQLNETGQFQADELGKRLSERYAGKLTQIITSPLGRAQETATIIGRHFQNVPIQIDERFVEISHGAHDDTSYKARNSFCFDMYRKMEHELKERGKEVDPFFKWKVNPLAMIKSSKKMPAGMPELETVMNVFLRAQKGMLELATKYENQIVLVSTHACVGETMRTEAEFRERDDTSVLPVYYEPKPNTRRTLPGNCEVYHFKCSAGVITFVKAEELLTQPAVKIKME